MSERTFVETRTGLRWHIVLTPTRAINGYRTLCGRNGLGPPMDRLPAGKACGSCDKIAVRQDDWPEDDGSTQPEMVP